MSPARNTADQAILSFTYTPGNSLAEQLPIELISSIASFLVGSDHDESQSDDDESQSDDDESHTPYGLHHLVSATHVCHRWREAILNDPRLWTDIEFSGTPHASDILHRVLPLSGNLALKISADFEATIAPDLAYSWLDQISNVSTRCDTLTLIFPREMCEDLICQARPFPKLRCLSLAPFGFPDRFEHDSIDYPKFWKSFPVLKELTLFSVDGEWMRPLPSARCLETVVIEIDGDAGELFFDFINMLSSSETITSVTFHAMWCREDSENLSANSKMEVFVNKKIETLCLRDYGVRLLHYVSFSALRSFRAHMRSWLLHRSRVPAEITDKVLQDVIDFLAQANPPLENITLGADKFPLFALPSVLRAVPHLKAFSLHADLFSDLSFLTEFFDELSKKCSGVFEVVPVLEKLSIALCSESPMDDKLVEEIDRKHFVKMIQERTASCMRSVSVSSSSGYCGLREEDVLALQECERRVDGLEIELEIDILQDDEEDGIQ